MQAVQDGGHEGARGTGASCACGIRQGTDRVTYCVPGLPAYGGTARIEEVTSVVNFNSGDLKPWALLLKDVEPSPVQSMAVFQGASLKQVFGSILLDGHEGEWVPVLSDTLVQYVPPPTIRRMVFVRAELAPKTKEDEQLFAITFLDSPEWKALDRNN